ncbi:zinc finger protein 271-like [Sardina pilchardus]|uniref:zinc finger protein 271-like n=1 Tax=Sardina pilchardus TaxID=27697 RepID=UPI002E15579F
MDACKGHALLLEQRQGRADSKQSLSDQMEFNLLLRLQVEDLQKRLDEKDNKLTHAQETISALRNEVRTLQEQLAFEKRKHQKPQSLKSRHVRAKIEAKTMVCRDSPSADLSCRTRVSPTDPSCNDITEGLARSPNVLPHILPIMSENWPLSWRARSNDVCVDQPFVLLSRVLDPTLTQSSSLGRNRARPSLQRSVKTLSVSLEDCRRKLGPDGVFKVLDRKDVAEEEEAEGLHDGSHHTHKNEDLFSGLKDSLPVEHKEDWMNAPYCCSQCSRRFSKPILLNLHLRMHAISQTKCSVDSEQPSHSKGKTTEQSYSCNLCTKTFAQLNHLKLHQRTHRSRIESQPHVEDGQRTLQKVSYVCDQCSETFSRINYLTLHKRRHKTSLESSTPIKDAKKLNREISHACDQCNKRFSQVNYLRLHQRMHRKPPESPVHSKDVTTMSTLKMTYPCDQCNKTFSQVNYLRLHQRMHRKPPESPVHSKDVTTMSTLTMTYPCDQCNKRFSQVNYLKLHQRMHRGPPESPVHIKDVTTMSTLKMTYPCHQCDKTFSRINYLRLHQKVHVKILSFQTPCSDEGQARERKKAPDNAPPRCGACGKVFSSRASLQVHQRVHANEKPHACAACDRTFGASSGLRTHRRKRHKGPSGARGGSFPRRSREKPSARTPCPATTRRGRLLGKLQEHLRRRPTGFASAPEDRGDEQSHAATERPFACPSCGQTFGLLAELLQHARVTHAREQQRSLRLGSAGRGGGNDDDDDAREERSHGAEFGAQTSDVSAVSCAIQQQRGCQRFTGSPGKLQSI